MSQVTKQVTKETTSTETVHVECDRCGKKDRRAYVATTGPVDWYEGRLEVREVGVCFRKGWNCPDGGAGKLQRYDICPDCAEGWLFPLLEKELGKKPTETEWDW
jgi:hypothetical protein